MTKSPILVLLRRLGAAVVCVLALAQLNAETLLNDTAVFAQSDPKSPVLTRLKSGTTVVIVGDAPTGWRRIEITAPIEAYVRNRDLTKALDVKDGANIYAGPKKDAQILTVAAAGDQTEITGLHGDYCQIKLQKKLQGFIAVGETANTPSLYSTTPAPVTPAPTAAAPVTTPGHPVAVSPYSSETPRMFAGRLVLARRVIVNPNPLYTYQLMDASGRRFAYIDTKRLMLTDKIENYVDRDISVTGTIRNTIDGKDLVIAAESMQLK